VGAAGCPAGQSWVQGNEALVLEASCAQSKTKRVPARRQDCDARDDARPPRAISSGQTMLRDSWEKKTPPQTNSLEKKRPGTAQVSVSAAEHRSLENLSGEQEGRNQLLLSDSGSCRGPGAEGVLGSELVIVGR